jgi:hypothetical protein
VELVAKVLLRLLPLLLLLMYWKAHAVLLLLLLAVQWATNRDLLLLQLFTLLMGLHETPSLLLAFLHSKASHVMLMALPLLTWHALAPF